MIARRRDQIGLEIVYVSSDDGVGGKGVLGLDLVDEAVTTSALDHDVGLANAVHLAVLLVRVLLEDPISWLVLVVKGGVLREGGLVEQL